MSAVHGTYSLVHIKYFSKQHVFFSFILEGTTKKVFKFYTSAS